VGEGNGHGFHDQGKDGEFRPDTAEIMAHVAAAHLMLRRLAWFFNRQQPLTQR
jgi:hypothetical protein